MYHRKGPDVIRVTLRHGRIGGATNLAKNGLPCSGFKAQRGGSHLAFMTNVRAGGEGARNMFCMRQEVD